jgi:PAS domain S-box-containing protein
MALLSHLSRLITSTATPPAETTSRFPGSEISAADARSQIDQARYQALVEQIPAVTFVASLEGGKNEIYVSPQIEGLLGFTQEEWISSPILWFTQIHPDDRARISTGFAEAVISGNPFRGIFKVLARDGSTLWVNGEARFVRDHAGRPLLLQGVAFDVTEQQRGEEMRRRLETERLAREIAERERSRLHHLFESLPAAITILRGPDYVVEFMNSVARDLAGVGPERIGKPFREVFPELVGDIPLMLDPVYWKGERFIAQEKPFKLSHWNQERHFTLVSQPLSEPNKTVEGVLIHAVEVSQEVQARAAVEEALRVREEFLSIAAHELMTPMTGMSLAVKAAQRITAKPLTPESARSILERLRSIADQVDRLMRLASGLLDATRISTGRLTLDLQEVDLGEVVIETVDHLVAAKGRHNIKVEAPSGVLGRWDRLRLGQVVSNLVSNALKYGEDRPIDIITDKDGRFGRLQVRDRGVGITAQDQERIFKKYVRGSSLQGQAGFGLGLWITRQIVNAMGGEILVESAPGMGSTFTVLLPLKAE